MPRLFALLIAVLLPLQLVWGAAAGYCAHEPAAATASGAAPHFGHHEHVHHGGLAPAGDPSAGDTAAGGQPDNDCGPCHAIGTAALAQAAQTVHAAWPAEGVADGLAPRFRSALARAPDRPQWPRLA